VVRSVYGQDIAPPPHAPIGDSRPVGPWWCDHFHRFAILLPQGWIIRGRRGDENLAVVVVAIHLAHQGPAEDADRFAQRVQIGSSLGFVFAGAEPVAASEHPSERYRSLARA
jgi:hypothetical protein